MQKAAWRHAIAQGDETADTRSDVTYSPETVRQITCDAERTIADSGSIDPDLGTRNPEPSFQQPTLQS